MSDYDGGTDLEPLDVEVDDATGTDLALREDGEIEPQDIVDGEIVEEGDELPDLVLEGYGVAYQPHERQATSDAAVAATTGQGFSGAGFKMPWERTGAGPGGGGGKPKPGRRRRGGGGGSGGGINVSLFGGLFTNFRFFSLSSSVGSNNHANAAAIQTGRPQRSRRPRPTRRSR